MQPQVECQECGEINLRNEAIGGIGAKGVPIGRKSNDPFCCHPDCLHLSLYKSCKDKFRNSAPKCTVAIEGYLGTESGFTLDRESSTLAIVCKEATTVIAFETFEILHNWQDKLHALFCKGKQCSAGQYPQARTRPGTGHNFTFSTRHLERHYLVHIVSLPAKSKLQDASGPARLLLRDYVFCLVAGIPPRLLCFWPLEQLRRFGVVDGKFCFEGGSKCGKGICRYFLRVISRFLG